MAELVGCRLIETKTGKVIQEWGGAWGQVSVPTSIIMPNGDILLGPVVGEKYGEYSLVPWFMEEPDPTSDNVIVERSRRLALGFDYDFGDARGVHHIGTTAADLAGWDEVSKAAQAAINLGAADAKFEIVTDTGLATLTAMEWQLILVAAGQHRQPIWATSFALQAMAPIPRDYANDKYWPATPVLGPLEPVA